MGTMFVMGMTRHLVLETFLLVCPCCARLALCTCARLETRSIISDWYVAAQAIATLDSRPLGLVCGMWKFHNHSISASWAPEHDTPVNFLKSQFLADELIGDDGDEKWTRLNSLWLQHIWTPEVEIVNMKEFKAAYFLNKFSYLDLYESKTLWYNFPAVITLECPLFTFESYPLDVQSCEIIIKSYQYYNTEIHYSGAIAYKAKNQRPLQYRVKSFKLLGPRRRIFRYKEYWMTKDGNLTSGYYNSSCVVSRIKLERSIQRHMMRTYLPTSLFVLSSWIGFLIDADAIPGRIALSVTLLLVLTQIR